MIELRLVRSSGSGTFFGIEAATVTLTSSDPSKVSVPATLVIPTNADTVFVPVTGIELTGATPVTISATSPGYTTGTPISLGYFLLTIRSVPSIPYVR